MRQFKARLRGLPIVLLGIFLAACQSAQAQPKFNASELTDTNSSQLLIGDLDGDGLKDLILLDELNLSIFYQDPQKGFAREPQQTYQLEARPCMVWAARLGGPSESLLVMNSDGVTELCFTNRTGPPACRQIIRQPTIIPEVAEETNAMSLPLSAETGSDWPLLLVPTAGGLQVWQHRDEWRLAQVLDHSVESTLRPSVADPGYSTSQEFELSVGDVNGDGRDDIMLRRGVHTLTNTYRLYLQQTNGLFAPEPALTYADKVEPFSWLCWTDLNRDGKVDLVKGTWQNEPSFIPGVPSAKVLVRTYVADAQGQIPAVPQQVFRKNDWVAAVPVVDIDGDGFPDLVLGYNHLESKEDVTKEITARQLDYSLRFYFYRPGAGFPTVADCQRDVAIHLDHAENPFDWTLPQNFERYVRIGGDFMGDGKKDLLVRDHSEDISAYSFISRQDGFSRKPDLRFLCPESIYEWFITDLNRDGISDLIVKLEKPKGWRIFVSRK